MKKLLIIFMGAFIMSTNAQVMVVSEVETRDLSAFEATLDHWMNSVKKATELEDAQLRVHQIDGSRELVVTRWFDSLKDMVEVMDEEKEKEKEIGENFEDMPEGMAENWSNFVASTDFDESSVWEYVPESSSTTELMNMPKEKRDEMLYRRVQYFEVDTMQGEAFEAWWEKAAEADKKLGINYHYAMFRSVFGGHGADYMVVLIDKSRFDYYRNWEARMKERMADENFKAVMGELDAGKWTVVKESNWNRMAKMTH